jgi:hypothetical protein
MSFRCRLAAAQAVGADDIIRIEDDDRAVVLPGQRDNYHQFYLTLE